MSDAAIGRRQTPVVLLLINEAVIKDARLSHFPRGVFAAPCLESVPSTIRCRALHAPLWVYRHQSAVPARGVGLAAPPGDLRARAESSANLTWFDARFLNDDTGAPAYPPAVLLKVVLFAYAREIVSSRAIARACTEHETLIALCGDRRHTSRRSRIS